MQLFFWPFMIASLVLSILSIIVKKPKLLIISAILIIPLSLYLAATPRFELWGLIFPFLYVGSALTLVKRKFLLSILLIIPNFLLIGWLGVMVLIK